VGTEDPHRSLARPAKLVHLGVRDGSSDMSELVTWSDCPRCGGQAAIGWEWIGEEGGIARPVEYDCRGGCQLTAEELGAVLPRAVHPGE
jgi:hypothetical protein